MLVRHELADGVVGYEMGQGQRPWIRVWAWRVGNTLIDTGCHRAGQELVAALEREPPIRHILLTHHHEDHSGNAARLQARFGCPVTVTHWTEPLVRHGFSVRFYQWHTWGCFRPFQPDRVLELPPLDEVEWETEDGSFQVIHLPGHSHDLSVVLWEEGQALFSADLYLNRRLKFLRQDEVWAVHTGSLERMVAREGWQHLMCGHRPVPDQGRAALRERLAFQHRTTRAVEEARAAGCTERQIRNQVLGGEGWAIRLYTGGDACVRNLVASILGQSRPRKEVVRHFGEAVARCRFDDVPVP